MKYAVQAIPGYPVDETIIAVPADGCERIDPDLGRYETLFFVDAETQEAAFEAALVAARPETT